MDDILKKLGMESAKRAKSYGSVIGHHAGRSIGLITQGIRHPRTGLSMGKSFFTDIFVHAAIGMARAAAEYELVAAAIKEANSASCTDAIPSQGTV